MPYKFKMAILAVILFAGCKKEESQLLLNKTSEGSSSDISDIKRFLSVVNAIPLDSIKNDVDFTFFYIPNTNFKITVESAKQHYERANEYKQNIKP